MMKIISSMIMLKLATSSCLMVSKVVGVLSIHLDDSVLLGVDTSKTIYIARVDEDNNVLTVYSGKLGVGFKPIYKYNNPTTLSEVTMNAVKEIIANGSDDTTKVTEDNE